MQTEYRIILQIKTPEGWIFRLWDSSAQIFTGFPKTGTRILQPQIFAEEKAAKNAAGELFKLHALDYSVRFEPIPEKFELIEAKGF